MPRKRRTKHPAEVIIAAIKDSAGIKTTIGKRLDVHRNTIEHYLVVYPSVALAYKNEVESVGDFVEAVILESIKARDVETAKWYAKNKLRHRGYSERVEHTGEEGNPIKFIVEVPPRKETAEEWVQQYQQAITDQKDE